MLMPRGLPFGLILLHVPPPAYQAAENCRLNTEGFDELELFTKQVLCLQKGPVIVKLVAHEVEDLGLEYDAADVELHILHVRQKLM